MLRKRWIPTLSVFISTSGERQNAVWGGASYKSYISSQKGSANVFLFLLMKILFASQTIDLS
jgi:hypothetical protein